MTYIICENSHAVFKKDFSLYVLNQETLLLSPLAAVWKAPQSFAYSKSESLAVGVGSTDDELHPYFGWL